MLKIYTVIHTIISLVAIVTGLVVLGGMLIANPLESWTAVFLWTTIATNVTGLLFPFKGFKPSYVIAVLSLVLLTLAYRGLYVHHLAGSWRWIYVVTAVISLYFNVFVLIVQSYQKIPALHALVPTQTERPFKLTVLGSLILFVALGTFATIHFR